MIDFANIAMNFIDKALFRREIEQLLSGGVDVQLNSAIDAARAARINETYDAVYLACGLGEPNRSFAAQARGCMSAEAFLRLANAGGCRDVSGTVIVQGGGNTAIDAAVTAKKLGAERAILCYRRSQREMPAWADEMVLAVQAGVEFLFQTQVLGVVERDGAVTGVTLAPVALGEADASGRRRPIVREDERYTREAAMVLTATGKSRGDGWAGAFDAAKLFVGGDAANGGATVVQAVAEAKAAVAAIDEKLNA